jgi:F0F1-type ATP synthase membrane subunit b/b'
MKSAMRILLAALVVAGLSACERDKGPAEQAGEQVDKAMQETREHVGEAVEKAGEKVEEAGDQLREKTQQ